MQNKKSLLHRLLVIYITFFIVLVASIAHGILPNFTRGVNDGMEMGAQLAEKYQSGSPRMIYILSGISIHKQPELDLRVQPTTPGQEIKAQINSMSLMVEEDAHDSNPIALAFRSIGGNGWFYAMTMIRPFIFLAIIILMFVTIHSIRSSIREERTLDKHNVWYLRAIGLLTITAELIGSLLNWLISHRAATLLSQSGYRVDTSFELSYTVIIMGILVLFAAEVFAIGYNLSEEQKLTI